MYVCANGRHEIHSEADRLPRDHSCRRCHNECQARYYAKTRAEVEFAKWALSLVKQQAPPTSWSDDA